MHYYDKTLPNFQNCEFPSLFGSIFSIFNSLLEHYLSARQEKENDKVIKVVENNAYKTELNSSVRVVSIVMQQNFVDRIFNKLSSQLQLQLIIEMNEKIDNLQCSFLEWVTRDELELVLQNFAKVVADVKDIFKNIL